MTKAPSRRWWVLLSVPLKFLLWREEAFRRSPLSFSLVPCNIHALGQFHTAMGLGTTPSPIAVELGLSIGWESAKLWGVLPLVIAVFLVCPFMNSICSVESRFTSSTLNEPRSAPSPLYSKQWLAVSSTESSTNCSWKHRWSTSQAIHQGTTSQHQVFD